MEDPTAIGFDWSRNYVTQLFRPVAANGEANAARPYAVGGMWIFCGGIGVLFRQLSARMEPRVHGKWVEISGIAAMVYAALTVTRMHDLMISIALTFFVVANLVTLVWLWRQRRLQQWIGGVASLTLLLVSAFVYYRGVGTASLPALQKLSFVTSATWLLWVHRHNTAALPSVIR
ncbi:MAG: hypothetical protein U0Q16_03730 [Bryobacteraceae bacterium]